MVVTPSLTLLTIRLMVFTLSVTLFTLKLMMLSLSLTYRVDSHYDVVESQADHFDSEPDLIDPGELSPESYTTPK